jgi:hypothetical protein
MDFQSVTNGFRPPRDVVHHLRTMDNPSWEGIAGTAGRVDYTDRLKVEGGWLYRTRTREGVALTFVQANGTARYAPAAKNSSTRSSRCARLGTRALVST